MDGFEKFCAHVAKLPKDQSLLLYHQTPFRFRFCVEMSDADDSGLVQCIKAKSYLVKYMHPIL